MRNVALLGVAAAVVLGLGGVVAASTGSQAAEAATGPRTLTFDVVFSPFELVEANNERVSGSPIALGDEIVFHDQLSTKGRLTLHLARLAGR
jgi:hypothetical protein